jgi:predicted RNase H-like HicB family nuclease
MKTYHIRITTDEDWYFLEAVEDESIFSQSRTLDEAVLMIRDVLKELKGETDAELRLIVPANLPVDDSRLSGRITDPPDDAEDDAVGPPPAATSRQTKRRKKSA